MKALWKRFRRRHSRRTRPYFAGVLYRIVGGELVLISEGGKPVVRTLPPGPKVRRAGRGSLRGRIRMSADFDEPAASVIAALGMR